MPISITYSEYEYSLDFNKSQEEWKYNSNGTKVSFDDKTSADSLIDLLILNLQSLKGKQFKSRNKESIKIRVESPFLKKEMYIDHDQSDSEDEIDEDYIETIDDLFSIFINLVPRHTVISTPTSSAAKPSVKPVSQPVVNSQPVVQVEQPTFQYQPKTLSQAVMSSQPEEIREETELLSVEPISVSSISQKKKNKK